ncbi:MAG: MG2 domain-containing protein [Planctomycetota bacterium]
MSTHDAWTPAEREALEQELLELHFGCHEDPAALEARLDAEPALRALQRDVLAQAQVLEEAVRPEQPRLELEAPKRRRNWRWLTHPGWRATLLSAAALLMVLGTLVYERVAHWRFASFQRDHLHLTVSAPKAVPAGAPWSFTVQTRDLAGAATDCRVRWQALDGDGKVLGSGEAPTTDGEATVAIAAAMLVPHRVQITATSADDEAQQVFELSTANAGPLVHLSTDRPIYRPGERVFVRAVVLDRTTRLPLERSLSVAASLLDAKDSAVARDRDPLTPGGVASFVLDVPENSAGGEHTVRVHCNGVFADEDLSIVVRAFREPQLQKQIVLDRKSYAPGQRGSAKVTALRMGDNAAPAAGGVVRGALIVDGDEVWHEDANLDAQGGATFRFEVPREVAKGAARFVAKVTDGGVVETEVEPFVVPTGVVQVAAFPEGGELIAGVENGLYLECTDTLGRPIDGTGELVDDREQRVASFRTEHQGRAKLSFVPDAQRSYRVRFAGQAEAIALPEVHEQGVAMRLLGDDIAAAAPLRLAIAGRGNGPWLLGVFSRGALVGQTTLRADGPSSGSARLDTTTELALPDSAAGVLRVTVFDRELRPVAERLVRRLATRRLDVAVTAKSSELSPGDVQQLDVRTTDEKGRAVRAVLGVSVSDAAIASLGLEPRIGLADRAALFGDVLAGGSEKLEDFGDFFLASEHSGRNADLLLGTRGWRRFVWRNDTAAQAALAARGDETFQRRVLSREGFSQTPQVASNLAAAQAPANALRNSAWRARNLLEGTTALSIVALALLLVIEGIAALLRHTTKAPPVFQGFVGVATAGLLVFGLFSISSGLLAPADMKVTAVAEFEFNDVDGMPVTRLARVDYEEIDESTKKESAFDSGHWNTAVGLGGSAGGRFGGRRQSDEPLAESTVDEISVSMVRRFRADDDAEAPLYFLPPEVEELNSANLAKVRYQHHFVERQYAHRYTPSDDRRDFTPTICWQTLLVTGEDGTARSAFATTDAVTTWRVDIDAHMASGDVGRVGQTTTTFATTLPLQVEAKLPDEVTTGDRLLVPVAAIVKDPKVAEVVLQVELGEGLSLDSGAPTRITLDNTDGVGRGRVLLPITVTGTNGDATFAIAARAGRFVDRVRRSLHIGQRGFPHERSGGGQASTTTPGEWRLAIPTDAVPGSGHVHLKVYPSPIAALGEGLEGMLREPTGCFEQASSSNYPNTLVLSLIEASGDDVPLVAARARDLLPRGYAKITGYECTKKGYEWFGHDPGHEALTAYGLLQFGDMARVYDVDATMVDRTRQWLLQRRDGKGNYPHDGQDHHSFGGRSATVTNAYVTYALLQAGTEAEQLRVEIDALVQRMATDDPYELALIGCALQLAKRPEAAMVRDRLATLQIADGSLPGAKSTITMSGGRDAIVEATGFAVLAWLPDARHAGSVRRAIEYLQQSRDGHGTFGATQATIVALRAITAYAVENRTMRRDGTLRVLEGDRLLAERAFASSDTDAIEFDLWSQLEPGEHTLHLEVTFDGQGDDAPLPWSGVVEYHADLPADDPDTRTSITTALRQPTVREGETVALDVVVANTTDEELPTPMAIVGLPAGLELPTAVLDDLQKAERFAFWELRGRELVLYWRKLDPGQKVELTLDLVGRVPGVHQGPASRTWLYYTPAQKRWAAPLVVEVTAG